MRDRSSVGHQPSTINHQPSSVKPWRLIVDGPRPGAWNMALDEALWRAARDGGCPTLRLYSWAPPAVSLGRFQVEEGVDHDERRRRAIGLVRRPTGGRAVLHDREVTYSLTAAETALGATGVLGTYRRIQRALQRAIRHLGVGPELVPGEERGRAAHPSCFAAAAPADGTVMGRKLIGSAQSRHRGVLLQHGSLLLDYDTSLWQALFGPGDRAVSLAELLGRPPEVQAVHHALARGFADEFGVLLEPAWYSTEELVAASGLVERYANDLEPQMNVDPSESTQ